ncbi:MAG: MBL fold metallo-hydrolase [Patescibacteria group bacterium]
MQIKYLGNEKFEVRTKDVRIDLGYKIKVNDFSFPGPGEYEKNGIFIEGIVNNGNTIYLVRADDINICYLGNISHDLREDEAKEIGDVDILFVPMGEDGSLPTKKALGLVSLIDPKIVIPMLYSDLTEFKKSEGINDGEIEIFKIKKADLPINERQNIILTQSK